MAQMSALPFELLRQIFGYCCSDLSKRDLYNIALVNWHFHQIVTPILYRHVVFRTRLSSDPGAEDLTIAGSIKQKHKIPESVIQSFRMPGHVGIQYIRHLTILKPKNPWRIYGTLDAASNEFILWLLRSIKSDQLQSLQIGCPTFKFLRLNLKSLKSLSFIFPPIPEHLASCISGGWDSLSRSEDFKDDLEPEQLTDLQHRSPNANWEWCSSLRCLEIGVTGRTLFMLNWAQIAKFSRVLDRLTIVPMPNYLFLDTKDWDQRLHNRTNTGDSTAENGIYVRTLIICCNEGKPRSTGNILPENLQTIIQVQNIQNLTIHNCIGDGESLRQIAGSMQSLTSLSLIGCCTVQTLEQVLLSLPTRLKLLAFHPISTNFLQCTEAESVNKAALWPHKDSLRTLYLRSFLCGHTDTPGNEGYLGYTDFLQFQHLEELAFSIRMRVASRAHLERLTYGSILKLAKHPNLRYLRLVYSTEFISNNRTPTGLYVMNDRELWTLLLSILEPKILDFILSSPGTTATQSSPLKVIHTTLSSFYEPGGACFVLPRARPQEFSTGVQLMGFCQASSMFPCIKMLNVNDCRSENMRQ